MRDRQRSCRPVLREERLALVRHGRQPGRNVERPVSAGGVALRETAHTFDVSTLAHLATIKEWPSGRPLFSPSPFNRHDGAPAHSALLAGSKRVPSRIRDPEADDLDRLAASLH